MRRTFIGRAALFVIPLLLGSCEVASRVFAASSGPGSLKAKGEAEKQGYTFITTNDEIVAGARKESSLRVVSQFDPRTNKAWINAFKKRYPFIDVYVDDAPGRIRSSDCSSS